MTLRKINKNMIDDNFVQEVDELSNNIQSVTESLAETAINVKSFGALGDGETDDTVAIQDAINHVSFLGGGVVYFPSGTYIVIPNSSRALYVQSNTVLRGAGYSSVIKVKDNVGDFQQVLSSETNGTFIENVIIEDLTFDNNILNNTSSLIGVETSTRQFTISFRNFYNVKINRVKFLGSGANTVILGSFTERSKYASVMDCHFEFKKRPGQPVFDNTMLYTNCYHTNITDNTFEADGNIDVYTGFEVHGGDSTISNNKINNVRVGFHITSDSPQFFKSEEHTNISVTNNTIRNSANGFFLWALTGTHLKNVTVSNNNIEIRQSMYNLGYNTGIGFWRGVDVIGDFENINIYGNTVTFEKETHGRNLTSGEFKYQCTGIGVSPFGNANNVIVANNIIENAPVIGIAVGENALGKVCNSIKVHSNQIINSGNNPLVDPISFRSAIYVTGIIKNSIIENNIINDNTNEMIGYNAYSVDTKTGTENLVFRKNEVSAKNGSYRIDNINVQMDEPVKVKYDDITKLSQGKNYDQGDIVYNTGVIVPGTSYIGAKVTTKGTGGTLSGVTATYTSKTKGGAKYPVVTMNDTSKIRTGNRITIDGVGGWWNVVHVAGNEVTLWTGTTATITEALLSGEVKYYAPVLKTFGLISA